MWIVFFSHTDPLDQTTLFRSACPSLLSSSENIHCVVVLLDVVCTGLRSVSELLYIPFVEIHVRIQCMNQRLRTFCVSFYSSPLTSKHFFWLSPKSELCAVHIVGVFPLHSVCELMLNILRLNLAISLFTTFKLLHSCRPRVFFPSLLFHCPLSLCNNKVYLMLNVIYLKWPYAISCHY